MRSTAHRAVAIVGVGSILPDAPDVATFWNNLKSARYSIRDVPSNRWDPDLYFDTDRGAPDKTYSRIGGWVGDWDWDPLAWRLPIPPKVAEEMDEAQRWAIAATRTALLDYGQPDRKLDPDRTAVILGNAMGGEKHYRSSLRINYPEIARELQHTPSFSALPGDVQQHILEETQQAVREAIPDITEDTMPGELGNCIAGRIANLFNFHGPNYVVDAACASAMAAMSAAMEGLEEEDFDAVITGGIDRNMGAATFVKFSKIGALSATGTRPYADGADGFVMGEGSAVFVLKRLADAEADGDHIYAVLRGMGGSSDGRGKGITAPNPIGQQLAIRRGWENAGLSPATAGLVEGHGTSTKVGDVVEVESLSTIFGAAGATPSSIRLGSVKSNIGHLKGAAGAAGILKTVMALHDKIIPPSLNFDRPNPNIDFGHSPFRVNTELEDWEKPASGVRRAGVSAFGFGGTNFHAVLEEHLPGMIDGERRSTFAVGQPAASGSTGGAMASASGIVASGKTPLRGSVVVGAPTAGQLVDRLRDLKRRAESNRPPQSELPAAEDLHAEERVAIDYGDPRDLSKKLDRTFKAFERDDPRAWKLLASQGIFRGRGPAPRVAFLYTGQGSQYVNMLQELRQIEPVVAETFAEADEIMQPLLGKPLSEFIFIDGDNGAARKQAEEELRQTAITQPAVLATDIALTRLLASYGIRPGMVMGHSLGEYAALVAAGTLSFGAALEAVSARGREMTRVSVEDNGKMAAVFAPLEVVQKALSRVEGYVVIANINSNQQAVIGGTSDAVDRAMALLSQADVRCVPLTVSHAFHTKIVAPASDPLREALSRLTPRVPRLPVISNVTGDFYPSEAGRDAEVLDLLARQVASPVQFIRGLENLYDAGCRAFVEVGPKRALVGFVDDVLGDRGDVISLFTNHPKLGDVPSFNQGLVGLWGAGLGRPREPEQPAASPAVHTAAPTPPAPRAVPVAPAPTTAAAASAAPAAAPPTPRASTSSGETGRYEELGRMLGDFLERSWHVYSGSGPAPAPQRAEGRTVVSGASLGLPGTPRIFDEQNLSRILAGEVLIDAIPHELRNEMAGMHVTRLVKRETGDPTFEAIDDPRDVIKLAGRPGQFELGEEYGVRDERLPALDPTTKLAIAAGIDALRDAGIPLVLHYKTTTKGTKLPERWRLPDDMRDDTGVIFASAFPGMPSILHDCAARERDEGNRRQLAELESLRATLANGAAAGDGALVEIDQRIAAARQRVESEAFAFDRRYLFRALSMGHSQFAEEIGARGPNTQVNCACASTTQALGLAHDWIQAGRCRRVVIVSADTATQDGMLEWIGAGFLASGAAATDEDVADAALPFDRRRHGMLLGMGAAALVVEDAAAVDERGMLPIVEVLGTVTANSAFHGTRLDVEHITGVMEQLVAGVEKRWGLNRSELAPETVFVSHETYTPARGGSAAAEIHALRQVFGPEADRIVIANTKGYTGHAMGVGIEDVVALKALETGIVPPVPNFREVDPELGQLNLSRGGAYPVRYALRLAAGFGSQISMSLVRWIPPADGQHRAPDQLGFAYRVTDRARLDAWLARVSGYPTAQLEVDHRRLRVRDQGPPAETGTRVVPTATTRPAAAPVPRPQPAAPTPTPVAATPAAPPAATAASPAGGAAARVLAIVSEQTGYPTDMLDMELDLEADLGIDTVKQAEVFAAVREAYGIERDENLQLRDFPTLKHVVQFAEERVPQAAAASAAAPTVTPPAPAAGADAVQDRVLDIVSEQTGYPTDMLDMELDLEADLGIDTVKQAEMFAAIRAAYDIPRDENLQLRDFPTLQHVVEFARDRMPGGPPPVAASAAPAATVASPPVPAGSDPIQERVLAIVSDQTGYPPDMLDMELDLEADLGIDTVKQAEMFAAIRSAYDIPRDESLQLRDFPTLQHVVGFARDRMPGGAPPAPTPATAPVVTSATVAAPAAAVATPVAAAGDDVQARVLAIVSDQTGYPPDMLDMELDLEADLGIDTVKQAEMFAAIRSAYDIPRDENLQLRDFPTLQHVVGFARDRMPGGPEPAPAPASTPSAEPAALPAAEGAPLDDVQQRVLAIVSEQTGYPSDMLDMELDLEADLGIDTVKQAEMFAAIRAAYDIPRDENLQLRDFPTLNHVVGFARDRMPASGAAATAATGAAAPAAAVGTPLLAGDMESANSIPRRVPRLRWRPSLDRFLPTGVVLQDARVVVMPDQGGVARSLVDRLKKQGATPLVVEGDPDRDALRETLGGWLSEGTIQGVYWLAAMDADPADLDLEGWRNALRRRVKLLHTAMQALDEAIGDAGTFLVAGTRLGGRLGYDDEGAANPLGGAVSGFVKAYKRERADTTCKVVDFPESRKTAALADVLIDETLADPGAVEIGRVDDTRWSLGLQDVRVEADSGGLTLDGSSVYVVTGAAGSIVSAIVGDLAEGRGGTFHLLDLTPEPDRSDPDLARFSSDRDGLKRDIFERLKATGERATPAMVERELARLERSAAAVAAIEAIEAAGGTWQWHAVDLTDAAAVDAAIQSVREGGRIDALIHAAGLEISRFVADKPEREYDLVFDVKADGWFNLMHAIGDLPLGAAVAFSSVAGRFGNSGQTDYSAANDLLCKCISSLKNRRPTTRGVAIDWTAWGGIGMATRGSIPKMMEAAGIDMLPPEAGIPVVRRELTTGSPASEIVVGDRLGILTQDLHPTGGLRIDGLVGADSGPMLGDVVRYGSYDGLVVETRLDPADQPFLHDHRIEGTPVLPGVMGVEGFAELSRLLLPERHVVAIEDVHFLAPFKFYRGEPRTVTLTAELEPDGDDLVARCRVLGVRTLVGQDQPQTTEHFNARVRLGTEPVRLDADASLPVQTRPGVQSDDVYQVYFHGPAYRVLDEAWSDGGQTIVGAMARDLPENHHPAERPLALAPRHLELCFQTAGVYELGTEGRMGLPMGIGRVVPCGQPSGDARFTIVHHRDDAGGGYDAELVDQDGNVFMRMENYRTVTLPGGPDADRLAPLRAAVRGNDLEP